MDLFKGLKLKEEDARKEISRFDDGSREFVKRYFHAEIEDPVHYDIVLNTNHFSMEGAASAAVAALNSKEKTMVVSSEAHSRRLRCFS